MSGVMPNYPCQNPNCHSFGKPHPNCKCGGYAKGGVVGDYCSEARHHRPWCEHYQKLSGGGEASDWEDVQPQEQAPQQSTPQQNASDWEDVPEAGQNDSDWEDVNNDKYSTTEQQVKAGLEGAARGVAGPIAPWVETHLMGVKPEDYVGREQANPITSHGAEAATLVGGMLTGVGGAGLIAKGAEAAAMGSKILKGVIEGASFVGSDEITKAMLGQGDPENPVGAALAHVGAGGLVGGLGGLATQLGEGLIGKVTNVMQDPKAVSTIENAIAKLGESNIGTKALEQPLEAASYKLAGIASAHTGLPTYMSYEAIKTALRPTIEKVAGKLNERATDGAIRAIMTNEISGLPNAIHYATQVGRGMQRATSGIDALFSATGSQIAKPITDSVKNKFKQFIEHGQVDQQTTNSLQKGEQKLAAGGMVSSPASSGFANVFPEQNILLNSAKGRVSNYLNSIRPLPNQQKLPFDDAPPEKEKNRSYDKAVDLALEPLSILDHVNKGTITPEHMKHFSSMYPEVHRFLSSQMTKRITEAQINGEKPPYNKRQSMSLFLGAELDSTFTPQSLQLLQSQYASKQPATAPQGNAKKSTAPLSKAPTSLLTSEQARTQRMQTQKA